jgi:hypothetical protein
LKLEERGTNRRERAVMEKDRHFMVGAVNFPVLKVPRLWQLFLW